MPRLRFTGYPDEPLRHGIRAYIAENDIPAEKVEICRYKQTDEQGNGESVYISWRVFGGFPSPDDEIRSVLLEDGVVKRLRQQQMNLGRAKFFVPEEA